MLALGLGLAAAIGLARGMLGGGGSMHGSMRTAMLGSGAGAWLAGRIDAGRLRRRFGRFVVAMGVLALGQELPRAAGDAVDRSRAWPWVRGGTAIVIADAARCNIHRRRRRAAAPQHDAHHHGSPDAVSPALRS